MTLTSIGSLTAGQQKADAAEPTAEQRKAAQDFEAIFLRQLLAGLEKSSGLSGGESSGGQVFRSMMVGSLADTAAQGGGIGLGELILKAMMPPAAAGKPHLPSATGAPAVGAAGVEASAAAGQGITAALDSVHAAMGPSQRAGRIGTPRRVLTRANGGATLQAAFPRGDVSMKDVSMGNLSEGNVSKDDVSGGGKR